MLRASIRSAIFGAFAVFAVALLLLGSSQFASAEPVPGEFLLCPQIALIFPVSSRTFPDTPIKFPVPILRDFVANLLI